MTIQEYIEKLRSLKIYLEEDAIIVHNGIKSVEDLEEYIDTTLGHSYLIPTDKELLIKIVKASSRNHVTDDDVVTINTLRLAREFSAIINNNPNQQIEIFRSDCFFIMGHHLNMGDYVLKEFRESKKVEPSGPMTEIWVKCKD